MTDHHKNINEAIIQLNKAITTHTQSNIQIRYKFKAIPTSLKTTTMSNIKEFNQQAFN